MKIRIGKNKVWNVSTFLYNVIPVLGLTAASIFCLVAFYKAI